MQDHRYALLLEWLAYVLHAQNFTVQALTGDASFRRYFRITLSEKTYIAMDAPPDREDTRPFIAIAKAFAKLNIQVPHIFAFELNQGFLLLSDLGDDLYLNELTQDNFITLYHDALTVATTIQRCDAIDDWSMPHFGKDFLTREWQLFTDWVLEKHWHISPNSHERTILSDTFELLNDAAAKQPLVCIHRDYHSRNLLQLPSKEVGVLDFQDAAWGPITYDAVSLLRDCYIDWPRAQIETLIENFYYQLREQNQLKKNSLAEFSRWFDMMGIQRNLKATGIFARLKHLYKNPNYIQYIPRGMNYVFAVSANYPELNSFRLFLQGHVAAQKIPGIIL